MRVLVDLVNGWSTIVRAAAGLEDEPLPPLRSSVEQHGRAVARHRREEVTAIADRLHPVFAGATASARRSALNEIVARIGPLPVATADGQRWRLGDARAQLEASLVLALAEHARVDPALDRLGVCSAHRCADVFTDATQARTRRYCSLTCQNRVKARAHRRRRNE